MGETKREAWEMLQMQALPLEAKIKMSKRRIRDWFEAWDGQVYVSFSGGKDSTALLHLVRTVYPDVKGVFCDTGLEYPEIKEFVRRQDNIEIIRPELSFRQVIMKYGYPIPTKEYAAKIHAARRGAEWALRCVRGEAKSPDGSRSRFCVPKRWTRLMDAPFEVTNYCCSVMKKHPMRKYERATGRRPIIGTMAEESLQRLQAWQRTGCNGFEAKHPQSAPFSFWTKNDVLQYLYDNKIEIAPVYGEIVLKEKQLTIWGDETPQYETTGCDRTGCVFCMFGISRDERPNRFERLKVTHPALYEYCMRPVDQGGLGIGAVLDYVNIPH